MPPKKPATPVRKSALPAPKAAKPLPRGTVKIAKPASKPVPAKPVPKTAARPAAKPAPKPEPALRKAVPRTKQKPLSRAELLEQEALHNRSQKVTKVKRGAATVDNIKSADEIRNKILNENEAKEIDEARKAILDRLRRTNNFVSQFEGEAAAALQSVIQTEFGFDMKLDQIRIHRAIKRVKKRVRLDVMGENGEDPDSQVDVNEPKFVEASQDFADAIVTAAISAREETMALKTLNMRASSNCYFNDAVPGFESMFGGKERALIHFARVGTLQESLVENKETGKMTHGRWGFEAPYALGDQSRYQAFVDRVATALGMKHLPGLGYKQILDTLTLRGFRMNAGEFGFFSPSSQTRFNVFGTVEADSAYGMFVIYTPAYQNADLGREIPPGMLIGYWTCIGITNREMKTLAEGRFDEHFDSAKPNAEVTKFIGKSLMTQFYNSTNRNIAMSIADLSLLNPANDTAEPDYMGKSDRGAVLYLPSADLRSQFESWNADRTLPDELSSYENVPGTHTTYKDMFAGRVVYTDMKNRMMFYYTLNGDLRKHDFSSSSPLDIRDRAELMKEKSENPGEIKSNRDTMSFYGTSFTMYPDTFAKAYGYKESEDRFREILTKGSENLSGYRPARDGMELSDGAYITIEGLRDSFQGDKILFRLVQDYYKELSINAATFFTQGHRDVIVDDNSGAGVSDKYKFAVADYQQAPKIGIMLNVSQKPYTEWPHETDMLAKAKEIQRKLTKPNAEELAAIKGSFDGLQKINGKLPELMPHQVETLAIAANTNNAAFDVDMGGGKTVMAVLDMVRLMKNGITLEDGSKVAARPLVVMPGGKLVENYIDDVRKFFGDNLNIFVLETDAKTKAVISDNTLVEQMQNAPANTVFVTTYSWLTSGKKYRVTLRNEINADGSITPVEKVYYSRSELLKRVPITAVYLDESHKIKSKGSQMNAVCLALSSVPVKRLLTGTMISKDVSDIFQQMRFLNPTLIGSEARFNAQYMMSSEEASQMGLGKREQLRPGAEKEAREELRSNGVLQLRRSAWLHLLPKKQEKFIFVEMSPMMRSIYQCMLAVVLGDLEEALEKGIITQAQYNDFRKVSGALGIAGSQAAERGDSDDSDEDSDSLSGKALAAMGDVKVKEAEANPDDVNSAKRVAQGDALKKVQQNMGIMVAAMQDFLTAPEMLNPTTFNNSPELLQALRQAGMLDDQGNVVGLTTGPKDETVRAIIHKHFLPTGGEFIPLSKQVEDNNGDWTKCVGKVLVFHENPNAIIHMFNSFRKMGMKGIGMYLTKSEKGYANSDADLADFKDRENDRIKVLFAAEKSLLLGQNMQSANIVIRLSTPWTTGDYDQSIARAFRVGQKMNVIAYNIQVNGSFEVLKLVKLFTRESSNRKLSSDYDVPFKISPKYGDCNLDNHEEFGTEGMLRNFPVLRFTNPRRPQDGFDPESTADLFVELHDEIWKQEVTAAFGNHPERAGEPDYINDPFNKSEAARYHRMGLDGLSPMATGNDVIAPVSVDVTPRDANGKPIGHGTLATTGYTALFNGAVKDKPHAKTLKTQEMQKLAVDNDPGSKLRTCIRECWDAMIEAKPAYGERYDERRDEIQDELYDDFTNRTGKKPKDFNFYRYKSPADKFFIGIYNMVISRYSSQRGLAKLITGAGADARMNAHTALTNAKLLAGLIDAFRKAHLLKSEMTDDVVDNTTESETEDIDPDDLADDDVEPAPTPVRTRKSAAPLTVDDIDPDDLDDGIDPEDLADDDVAPEPVKPRKPVAPAPKLEPAKPVRLARVPAPEPEEEPEPVDNLPMLTLGLSKYYSDSMETAKPGDAKIMLFAPQSVANPIARKLEGVPLPSGKHFSKRLQFVFTRTAVSTTVMVNKVLRAIEDNGGNIQDKEIVRGKSAYNLTENRVLQTVLNGKAPSAKLSEEEHSIANIIQDKTHHSEVTAARAGAAQNIDVGFLVLDGRVTLIAFPDNDKKNFNAEEERILAKSGFKKIMYYVVVYTQAEVAKLEKDLIGLATKFGGTGVRFYNEDRFSRYVKYFTGARIDFDALRKPVARRRASRD